LSVKKKNWKGRRFSGRERKGEQRPLRGKRGKRSKFMFPYNLRKKWWLFIWNTVGPVTDWGTGGHCEGSEKVPSINFPRRGKKDFVGGWGNRENVFAGGGESSSTSR